MGGSKARFAQYFNPVLNALRALGGSGRPAEVCEWIADDLNVSEEVLQETLASGGSRFETDVAWARFYLVKSGYLDASRRGVWSLTDKGRQSPALLPGQILEIMREVQALTSASAAETVPVADPEQTAETEAERGSPDQPGPGYRERVLEILRSIPPDGFERFCQRLLRESGFQQVKVTGRSGDGGLDGVGLLQINPFVSFKVLFQCKRYQGVVGSPAVRDFRGAMMGRADKGLILTTGGFSADAKAEAAREGVPPIELVDGEEIVDLLEQIELGLIPRKTFEIDPKFFDEFR
jgi:restriction system protein